jgi:hypothetical protein
VRLWFVGALTQNWVQQCGSLHRSLCSNWCRPLYDVQSRWHGTNYSSPGALIGCYAAIDFYGSTTCSPAGHGTEYNSPGDLIGCYAALMSSALRRAETQLWTGFIFSRTFSTASWNSRNWRNCCYHKIIAEVPLITPWRHTGVVEVLKFLTSTLGGQLHATAAVIPAE